MRHHCKVTILLAVVSALASAFQSPPLPPIIARPSRHTRTTPSLHPSFRTTHSPPRTTQLNLLLDVPDGFFTVTFPMLGILLSISKSFGRVRMEERAWEQRLEEGRKERLRRDPSLTELDLRRREAALEWSAYGKPRMEEERMMARVKVMEREEVDEESSSRQYRMTEDEIGMFEKEYGIGKSIYGVGTPDLSWSLDRLVSKRHSPVHCRLRPILRRSLQ